MQDNLKTVMEWLGGNWGWAIAIFCLFFEISPIKLHPISAVLGWIGKKMTGDIRKDLSDLREDVDKQRMANIRAQVLEFANSCLNKRKHTKEEFDHIITENAEYEELIKRYNVKNEVYKEAYQYILRLYQRRMDRGDFLSVPSEREDVDN